MCPFSMQNASLLVSPVAVAAPNPAPISKPFTAPIERIAFARFASSFQNGITESDGKPKNLTFDDATAGVLFL